MKTPVEIGQELSVDYFVESSIRSESGRLRVTVKLIRVRDQEYVWYALALVYAGLGQREAAFEW